MNPGILEALFKYATEGILVSEKGGKIIMANPTAEKQFGYDSGELLGKSIENLVPRQHREKHVDHRQSYVQNPRPRSMGHGLDLYALRKDTSVFPVEISLSYFKADDKEYVMSFIVDITERKEQDEYILKMNRELEQRVSDRTQALAQANKELATSKIELLGALAKEKELNELKSRFVTTASHEFRTPLAAILSSVSLIDRYSSNETLDKRQKHIVRIKSMVNNLTEILNDFLSLSKLEEGVIRNDPERFELIGYLESIAEDMKPLLKSGQKINFSHSQSSLNVLLDMMLLKNVTINLLSNAIKYSPDDGLISFDIAWSNNELQLKVTDTGMGIPEEDIPHIFERFYRARNSINIQGTGLGLNITKKYVELMGGQIKMDSALGKGTSFTIIFPEPYTDKNQPLD